MRYGAGGSRCSGEEVVYGRRGGRRKRQEEREAPTPQPAAAHSSRKRKIKTRKKAAAAEWQCSEHARRHVDRQACGCIGVCA